MDNNNGKKVLDIKKIYSLIQSLVGQAHVLTIPRVFIDFTGDIHSALLLAQLIYWTERTTRPDGYIWKTYRAWEDELSLNKYHITKAANRLKDMGFLKTKVRKANGNPTVHYRLNEEEVLQSLIQFLNERKCKIPKNDNPNFELSCNIEHPNSVQSHST